MSLENSKKILKIFGILGIIGGIFMIILGVVGVALGGAVIGTAGDVEEDMVTGATVTIAMVIVLISGIVSLLEGIFSVRASKDTTKIQPAWIFAIIGLVSAVIGVVSAITSGGSFLSPLGTLAINGVIFMAANTIKKSNNDNFA